MFHIKPLIVIDMQIDFVTGALGSQEAVAILSNVKRKIEEYLAKGDEVIFTRDTHGEQYLETSEGKHLPIPHCIKSTVGWQVCPEIDNEKCVHIDKPTFGYLPWNFVFEGTRVMGTHEFDSIEIIGVCTDMCRCYPPPRHTKQLLLL